MWCALFFNFLTHNFSWLPALNIKTEKELGCLIIDQWINNFSNYNEKYWTLDIVTMRLIYWISSYEIIFKFQELARNSSKRAKTSAL